MAVVSPEIDARAGTAARRLVRLAFLCLLGVYLGIGWDRAWHATHPFEDFVSPPHLFIYGCVGALAGVVLGIGTARHAAVALGPRCRVPLAGLDVPAAVALAAGGVAVVGLGGCLDFAWHSAFGLDETGWSTPHALLGFGIALTTLGLVSCWLQARRAAGGWRIVAPVLAGLLLMLLPGVLLGPLWRNQDTDMVRAVSRLPVLAAEPDAQHTFRIYLEHGLTREHPLFLPFAALANGVALAVARGMNARARTFLLVAVVATLLGVLGGLRSARYFGLRHEVAAWMPVPSVLPAAVLVLPVSVSARGERVRLLIAGWVLALAVAAVWGAAPLALLLAGPLFAAGWYAGGWLSGVLAEPSGVEVAVLVGAGVVTPFALGIVDMTLRARTP